MCPCQSGGTIVTANEWSHSPPDHQSIFLQIKKHVTSRQSYKQPDRHVHPHKKNIVLKNEREIVILKKKKKKYISLSTHIQRQPLQNTQRNGF